jgi:tetraacyldisaccharide 4'-kinase
MTIAAERLARAWYRGAPWLWLLRPLEGIYRCLILLRRWGCHGGLMRRYRAPVPVVVVGNITVGGTGKTPVVIALVEHLQARGLHPGVVSRGYGAGGSDFPHRVSAHSTARDCGDEPLLIHRRTGCPVVVDPRRAVAVQTLLRDNRVDLVLCDDGLQHYALARDFEIALVDQQRQLGNGFCLPAGPLREPPSRLRSVDFVLYRGGSDDGSAARLHPGDLVALADEERRPFSPASIGPAVYAVAGIGQPGQFFDTLRRAGFDIEPRAFPDHHPYRREDLAPLTGKPVIMTEKDAVKCLELGHPDCWYLSLEAALPAGLYGAVVALVRDAA